jgi:hypothetical protein
VPLYAPLAEMALRLESLRRRGNGNVVEVSWVCRVEAPFAKIHFSLELTDKLIDFDKDRFVRIDRMKAMYAPCHAAALSPSRLIFFG